MNKQQTKAGMAKLANDFFAEYDIMTNGQFGTWLKEEKRHHAIEEIEGWLEDYTPLEESGRKLMARDMYTDLNLRN